MENNLVKIEERKDSTISVADFRYVASYLSDIEEFLINYKLYLETTIGEEKTLFYLLSPDSVLLTPNP